MSDAIFSLALWRGLTPQHEWKYGFPTSFHANLHIEGIETYDGERHGIMEYTAGVFTGKWDSNDNRIFTGDIVTLEEDENSRKYSVVYEDQCFYLTVDNTYICLGDTFSGDLKIVGNIYEPKV